MLYSLRFSIYISWTLILLLHPLYGKQDCLQNILQFDVCGGLTNQRISFIQGLLISRAMNRSFVYPMLYSSYDTHIANSLSFDYFYDINYTQKQLQLLGIHSTTLPPLTKSVTIRTDSKSGLGWSQVDEHCQIPYLSIKCSFFKYKITNQSEGSLYWKIDATLLPSSHIAEYASSISKSLQGLSNDGKVTVLHFRGEADWIRHCKSWEKIKDGIIRNNCMTNSGHIDRVLLLAGIPEGTTIYLAGGYVKEDMKTNKYLQKLASKFNVITKDMILGNIHGLLLEREKFAAIDFEVSRVADVFIGNSVSTFSAILLLSRERSRQMGTNPHFKHFHYNAGDIPLLKFLPLDVPYRAFESFPLKWIFVYNSNSDFSDDALKVAVQSAKMNTNLVPICLMYGKRSPLVDWMESKGVFVISHTPVWISKMTQASYYFSKNIKQGHLFASTSAMISTFLRIDIPKLGLSDPFVLYTDTDVMFLKDMTLKDFEEPGQGLPEYFCIGTEDDMILDNLDGKPYGNAGVMLLNLNNLMKTYDTFMKYTFSSKAIKDGLYYKGYGPGDQGAYAGFYSGKFKIVKYPTFNWKAYWPTNETAKLIHFHGPKPYHYKEFLTTKTLKKFKIFQSLLEKHCNDHEGCYQNLALYTEHASSLGQVVKARDFPSPVTQKKKPKARTRKPRMAKKRKRKSPK
jgi:hypothetical protein